MCVDYVYIYVHVAVSGRWHEYRSNEMLPTTSAFNCARIAKSLHSFHSGPPRCLARLPLSNVSVVISAAGVLYDICLLVTPR